MPEGRVLKMATQTKLEIKHISKSFPGVNALSDVTLVLKSGEIHSLVGENGAGKSTLYKRNHRATSTECGRNGA
jgi:ABC-type sugar transport system ATPase subunit